MDWVVLTNGSIWRVYQVCFGKPITNELLFEVDLLKGGQKPKALIEQLYLLSKEGFKKGEITKFSQEQRLMNRYTLAAILLSEPMLTSVRKELKKLNGSVKIDPDRLSEILRGEVFKREVTEGDKAAEAAQLLKKFKNKQGKAQKVTPKAVEASTAVQTS